MPRPRGLSVRWKLTLSYAGFLMVAGILLLAVVRVFLLRYVPEVIEVSNRAPGQPGMFIPNRSDLEEAFTPRAVAALGVLLVLGLVGGWVLAGRMLAPLNRITRATRLAAQGSLAHRIELEGAQDEFRELADSFDTMLAQLEAHVAEQRRFAANASHELRTPLAITKTLLDVAREDPNRRDDELDERLRAVNARAVELTEALLMLSRTEQRSFSREWIDLSLVIEEAAETLLPLAEQHDVSVETDGHVTPTTGSHSLLLQMATNLLHNAIVHNVRGHGAVTLSAEPAADAAVLTVENTGDALSPDLIATLTEPFQRGSERIRGHDHGFGLGLAIVKSIVRAHDGTLSLSARPTGGLRVVVTLPAAPHDRSSSDVASSHATRQMGAGPSS